MATQEIPHLPVLRFGRAYESLDKTELADHRTGAKMLSISQVNAGIVRKDLGKVASHFEKLQAIPAAKMLEICKKAGELFMTAALPFGTDGGTQTPEQYVENLSKTSGLPHNMCRRNMAKINQVFTGMDTILKGLTRGMDLSVVDEGFGEQAGVPVSYFPSTHALGVVLPSNSPGVNSLWMPAIALKVPVVLKPGREEPWTPWRIIQAFIAAGCPGEAFGFYPTDHEGADTILRTCGKALIFGDEGTTAKYAANPNIQVHGPGRSKLIIGEDEIGDWKRHFDVVVESILANGGRSCVNASAVLVPSHGDEIAEALAQKLGPVNVRPASDEAAALSGFANPKMAEWIDGTIEEGLKTPGAEDVAAKYRGGPRKVVHEAGLYLRPTVVKCASFEHPLANREFLFPYASVVEMPQAQMLEKIGPSLVVTAITKDPAFRRALLASPHIGRLNLGSLPTNHVSWEQPHEGNLFEFLYVRRAIQRAAV
ncbi:MAG: aldehyde dehydrogenase [Planctomycetota bacterium]|nr:aldehyde dehydrogenase [Planctomycetota bacterium]